MTNEIRVSTRETNGHKYLAVSFSSRITNDCNLTHDDYIAYTLTAQFAVLNN